MLKPPYQQHRFVLPILLTIPGILVSQAVAAQIIPDATLGSESSVALPVDAVTDRIEQGAIRGSALFHSFQEFNINEGHSAYFATPVGITNILSRVTGNDASDIFGTLGVEGTANLFFLNPNGIVFGPNAQLDVAGTAVFSTGDRFSFADGKWFSATEPNAPPLLTMNVTPGLQLGAGQAPITNNGQLSAGQDLTLYGSDLEVSGQLGAGANLSLLTDGAITVRDTPTEAFVAQAGGDLTLRGNQGIDILALQHLEQTPFVSGGDLTFISDGVISADAHFDSGGALRFLTTAGIPANVVSLYDPIMTPAGGLTMGDYTGAALKVETDGDIQMGDITITGPDTNLTADGSGSDIDLLASGRAAILRAGVNEAGNQIEVQPSSIVVGNIKTSDRTGEDGGPIILAASGNISTGNLDSRSVLDADVGNTSNGGTIAVSSILGDITIADIESSSRLYNGGSSFIGNSGDGGAISVSTLSGDINTGSIDSSSLAARGNSGHGGAVTISGKGNVTISGDTFWMPSHRSASINASSIAGVLGSSANGGDIIISSLSGDISIIGDRGRNRGVVSNSYSGSVGDSGNGGDISVLAQGNIDSAYFYSHSSASHGIGIPGNGGTITLSSKSGNISSSGIVQSSSSSSFGGMGNSGAITVSAQGDININYIDSSSFSREGGPSGNGGNITITSKVGNVLIGDIFSGSFSASEIDRSDRPRSAGNGGYISITAETGEIIGNRDNRLSELITASAAQSGTPTGYGGNVALRARSGISNLSGVTAASAGDSGDVSIQGLGDLIISNVQLVTTGQVEISSPVIGAPRSIVIDLDNLGQSGNTMINSLGNLTFEDVEIQASANSRQPAGNITVASSSQITFRNSRISSNANNAGNAGEIHIDAARLNLGNGGQIFATTSGSGDGGDITINATDTVFLGEGVQDFAPVISVEASDAGRPGNIIINTPNFVLSETARITATASETATNLKTGGSITLNADRMDLAGTVGIFAETQGQAPGGVLTLQPYQINSDLQMTLAPDAVVSASTTSSGNGGGLAIRADGSVNLSGPGRLAVESSGSGPAGNIDVTAQRLTLADGVTLSASATGTGRGGNINLEVSDAITVQGNSRIVAETEGAGIGGTLTVDTGSFRLADRAIVSARSNPGAVGDAGNITIAASDNVTLSEASQVSVETNSAGAAGDITINTPLLAIESDAAVTATATSNAAPTSRGGSIFLNATTMDLEGRVGVFSETRGEAPAGRLELRPLDGASNLDITLRNAARVSASTTSTGQGGDLSITADESITIRGDGRVAVETTGVGNAGTLEISTRDLTIDDGALLTAASNGTGSAGSVNLDVDRLTLRNGAQASVSSNGTALAGDLRVAAEQVSLANGAALIGETEAGSGANIDLEVNDRLQLQDNSRISALTASGTGGDISLRLNTLQVDNSQVLATAEAPMGTAGKIEINASDSVMLNGRLDTTERGGISVAAAGGNAGSLILATTDLTIQDGAELSVRNTASGQAGNLIVDADTVRLNQDGLINAQTEAGQGGNVRLDVENRLQLQNQSVISATTQSGTGGRIDILNADTIEVRNSQITATADSPTGTAGAIEVNSTDSISLRGQLNDSQRGGISVSAAGGKAGALTLNTEDLAIRDDAELSVRNRASGQAGSLVVTADTMTLAQAGRINAQTEAGQGGNVRLEVENTLQLQNQSVISATTQSGTGGRIDILNADTIEVSNSQIRSTADSPTGTAGAIEVNSTDSIALSGRLNENQRGGISVSAVGGDAGALTLTTRDLTIREGAELSVRNRASGQAGNLVVIADNVTLEQAGRINAQTEAGQGGNIRLEVEEALALQNRSVISATTQSGTGGRINILNANTVEVRDSQITATANRPKGTAGAIEVNASDSIVLNGRLNGDQRGGVSVSAVGGNAGALQLNTSSLTIQDGAEASVSNTGTGQAGNLIVRADTVWLQRDGLINAETDAGQRGNVRLRVSDLLSLEQGSMISAATQSGQGGSIVIQGGNQINVNNSTITSSAQTGRAGNVSIEARDSVNLSNNAVLSVETQSPQNSNRSGRLARSSARAATLTTIPQAGNLFIDSGQLLVNDSSSIFIRSLNGIAGNIDMVVSQVKLDDGQIRATTAENPNSDTLSANITMSNLDFLSLDNGSLISAEAQPGANGGNIRLNAEGGIIIATPNSNSDIIATAVDGTGGQIQITALQLLNLQESPGDFSSLRGDSTNDISVDSVSGIDGDIETDVNPFEVAVDLPVDTAPPALSQGCQPGNDGRGMFVNTGQGGIAISPDDPISGDRPWEDISPPKITDEVVEITEAEMWQVNENGQIVLNVASPVESTSLTCQS